MLAYVPGSLLLACGHCGGETPIDPCADTVEEQDYQSALATMAEAQRGAETIEVATMRCASCGASTEVMPGTAATHCPYCGVHANIVGETTRVLKPNAVLPFAIPRRDVEATLRRWVESLWFAPNALRAELEKDRHVDGLYLPYWTFDARTQTAYEGWRGDHYTVTVGHGKKRRTETRTRWSARSGTVRRRFDDVLVAASTSALTTLASRLGPWDLARLVVYDDRFVAGFLAESYRVELGEGLTLAQKSMAAVIDGDIRGAIGGNVQRIDWRSTAYEGITFKYVLLPLWVGTFRWRGRSFRFVVNGLTGRISAERPWSAVKIVLAILVGLVVAGIIALVAASR